MSKKKSNNPFKMWGSYVGALIGFVSTGILSPIVGTSNFDTIINGTPLTYGNIYSTVAGFLIGWGIYSLIRKYK